MIRFEPPGLEDDLKKALGKLEKFTQLGAGDLSDELVDPASEDFNLDETSDYSISEETVVPISLPRCGDSWPITYRQLIAWLSELEGAELLNNVECWTNRRCLLRVSGSSIEFFRLIRGFDQHHEPQSEAAINFSVEVAGRSFDCEVRSGLTLFGILVVAQGSYEKFFPPVLEDDLFIEIRFPPGTDREIVRNLVLALLFEISASIGIDLQPSPRPELYFEDTEDEVAPPFQLGRLRPLMTGKGLPELLRLYSDATAVSDPGLQVVMYAKVIEFVSQTVVRTNTTEIIRKKLLTSRGLDPDAAFIQELQESFEDLRAFRQDREAIRAAIEVACDVNSLVDSVPPFLKELKKLRRESSEDERARALTAFAVALVDTRNSIVHAKPNYRSTGHECPVPQLYEFAELAKRSAQQAIRWFHGRPEHQRIS